MRPAIGMNVQVFRDQSVKAGLIVSVVNPTESIVSCVQWEANGVSTVTGNIKFCGPDEPKPTTDFCALVPSEPTAPAPKTR